MMLSLMKKLSVQVSAIITVFLLALPAHAVSLQDAKQQGLVGEQTNGYLGAVVKRADVSTLVADVNGKRKQAYARLAKKNKLTLEQVAKLAGEKAIKKTRSGHFIQDSSGNWVKKK